MTNQSAGDQNVEMDVSSSISLTDHLKSLKRQTNLVGPKKPDSKHDERDDNNHNDERREEIVCLNPPPWLEPEKKPEGSECSVQKLFEGPPKCRCCINWVEEYPDDLRRAIEERQEVKEKALVVRLRKNHDDGKLMVLDSLVVQNATLKKTLSEVFAGYEGITALLKKVVFRSPFHPFYYRWQVLQDTLERQKQQDPPTAAFTQLLYDVLNTELREVITEVSDLIQHNVITFPLLWAIFEPGKHIVSVEDGYERFLVVESCSYEKGERGEKFRIKAKYVNWNGKSFGYSTSHLSVDSFIGTKRIVELEVFPAQFHLNREVAEAKAISRGRKFQSLKGLHYKAYSGSVEYFQAPCLMSRRADGRIVVDATSYLLESGSKILLDPLTAKSIAPAIAVTERNTHAPSMEHGSYAPYPAMTVTERNTHLLSMEHGSYAPYPVGYVSRPSMMVATDLRRDQTNDASRDLEDNELLLASDHVYGYSLKLKRWARLRIDDIHDIKWNNNAFSTLDLPNGFKNLILSFVKGQSEHKHVFDDVIEGKGMGIIMMLVGSPGVGKTLTAEAVADELKKPLYVLSAGELGRDPERVEGRLETVMKITERWDGILLFDECDVFIQERSTTDLAHNEIVAVFLRLLEYYKGIMFMTSNRADTIDKAFGSRIHLTMHYPDLEPQAKERIWKQFTAQSQHSLVDEDFRSLAQLDINGRQIKNIVKVSTLLASQDDGVIRLDQIRTVLRATGGFDKVGSL